MAKELSVKKCYILKYNETYGQGVAKAFEALGQNLRGETVKLGRI